MSNAIKPIKNELDYDEALKMVDTYFEAEEGTPEADTRDVLVVLIEKFEDEHYTIDVPDPVEAIKFRMDQEGLTQKDLIPYLGSRSKVSEVLSGKRDLSLKMIKALNKHLGIPAEVLLRDSDSNLLDDYHDIDFDCFPINEMKKHGAFDGLPDFEKIKNNAEKLIGGLISTLGNKFSFSEVMYRKSKSVRLNTKLNLYSLQGWLLHLLSKASRVKVVNEFKEDSINKKFLSSLVHLSMMDEGPRLAREFLLKNGIILEIVHHYKNTYLDGAAYKTSAGQPIIGLTLRYDRIDNFWFNLLHEIGHIKLHLSAGNYIADDMSLRGSRSDDKEEKEADDFAEKALIPSDFDLDKKEVVSRLDLYQYALKNNIHPAIIAGKIQYSKNNYRLFANMVGRGEVRNLFE